MNKNFKEQSAKIVFMICAAAGALALGTIFVFIFVGGFPTINKTGLFNFIFGTQWGPTKTEPVYGILPMIQGSVTITFFALIVGVPSGLMCRTYLAYFRAKSHEKALNFSVNLLAGIPSVVYGFFGIMVIVPAIRKVFNTDGNSILAAGILLGIMILPTMISTSYRRLKAVPQNYVDGALALGATKEQAVFKVGLPAAMSGISAGRVLSLGRAIGEATAVQMVAGNQPRITFDPRKGIRTMTANIAIEMAEASGEHRKALISTGLVLFVLIMVVNLLFFWLTRRAKRE